MKTLTVRPGTIPGIGHLFVTIKWDGHRLSLTGVSGPLPSGDARGGCGQILGELDEVTVWAQGWDADKAARLKALWKRWHLNDMRGGSPAQEAWLRANPVSAVYPESHYAKACEALAAAGLHPDPSYERNGKPYRYGSAWLTEEVPPEVVAELFALPVADRPNPWGTL